MINSSASLPCKHSHLIRNAVLNRNEAQAKLQTLVPGTEEHSKLQDVLIRTSGIVEVSLTTVSYKVDTASTGCALIGGFGASEHVAIGKSITLQGLPKDTPLLLKDHRPVQFQHIVALAGDFYAIYDKAISLPGGSLEVKTARFKEAFNTLVEAKATEINGVIAEIELECSAVHHSSLPHHCYSFHMISVNNAIKAIKDDIEKLLVDNSDHFSINAIDAYTTGHTLARQIARESGRLNSIEGLKHAYAIDAFACHFLTDLFAAGHIRNQRGELELFLINQLHFEPTWAKPLAGVLTGAQHEQDGNAGLNVENKIGEQWRAYGDGRFFSPENEENRKRVVQATQKSVDEVYSAFCQPNSEEPSVVLQLIPQPIEFNPMPLYTVENHSLFLYEGSKKIAITSKIEYLTKGLSQALRYLPQDYIDGFLSSYVPALNVPILDKFLVPQVERLTGAVWHMVGLATYHQVRQESRQLNAKIDELADIANATYNNSLSILKSLDRIDIKIDALLWNDIGQLWKKPILRIQGIANLFKVHGVTLDYSVSYEKTLLKAQSALSNVFKQPTLVQNQTMLEAYKQVILKQKKTSPEEVSIILTHWFREMLEYEVLAFNLYANCIIRRDYSKSQDLKLQLERFQVDLIDQITFNASNIDVVLINESREYIKLQHEKKKTLQLEAKLFQFNDRYMILQREEK